MNRTASIAGAITDRIDESIPQNSGVFYDFGRSEEGVNGQLVVATVFCVELNVNENG